MKKYFTIPAVALVLLSFLLLSAVSWKKKHQDIILHPVSFDDKENLASKYDSLETFIQEQVIINAIPALAAAMIQNGKVVWMKGFGVQNIDTKASATEETLFVTSSIAKLVVAVAVMQQKEQGKLNLDEDISKYLGYSVRNPNYPDIKITPRLLLTHQAGLSNPNQNEVPELTGFHVDTVINMKDWVKDFIIPSGAHYKPIIWQQVQPGTIHSSSNMGVTLLAHIVEKITGQDFRDYSTKYIFSKLKMNDTAYKMHLPGSFDPGKLADIYTINGTKLVDYIESPIYAAGLLRTSIKDWSKFMIAIMNGGVYEGKEY
ncbi:MAG: beta-lactamase family protein [Saprospiraceae bacterium]|nr:beta-lactamase family protein [Saprospiraceae bacterium]